MCADTFGVGIHLTDTELQFVVHVPSDVDSGWSDPDAFQTRIAEAVWERLDRQSILQAVAEEFETGETATLGTIALNPDGTVIEHDLGLCTPDADTHDRTERGS
ncbi:hypothetical protein [Halorubrum trueperi]|uniref:DUF8124 domain-containing protein n=1 Tax=Halorubrum trueperi TaxID=2004704 RepID=A0ABD5UJF8_9EURY